MWGGGLTGKWNSNVVPLQQDDLISRGHIAYVPVIPCNSVDVSDDIGKAVRHWVLDYWQDKPASCLSSDLGLAGPSEGNMIYPEINGYLWAVPSYWEDATGHLPEISLSLVCISQPDHMAAVTVAFVSAWGAEIRFFMVMIARGL